LNVIGGFFLRVKNLHNDGYKRLQTPHDVIYVNSIQMPKKEEIEYKFAINIILQRR
jgi:hypothetical protein